VSRDLAAEMRVGLEEFAIVRQQFKPLISLPSDATVGVIETSAGSAMVHSFYTEIEKISKLMPPSGTVSCRPPRQRFFRHVRPVIPNPHHCAAMGSFQTGFYRGAILRMADGVAPHVFDGVPAEADRRAPTEETDKGGGMTGSAMSLLWSGISELAGLGVPDV
jgi:hypothetical protein